MERAHQAEGPPPNDEDPDAGRATEDWILDRDRAVSEEHDTTVEAQRRGERLDERLHEETRTGDEVPRPSVSLGEGDAPDDEADLVATDLGEDEDDDDRAPETDAMSVVDEPPGATDHPDDMIRED
jgi:hypothetical protein